MLVDFIYLKACKPFCTKLLTLSKGAGARCLRLLVFSLTPQMWLGYHTVEGCSGEILFTQPDVLRLLNEGVLFDTKLFLLR